MTNADMFEFTFGKSLRAMYYSRPHDFIKWSDAEYNGKFALDEADDLLILDSKDRSEIMSAAVELMKNPTDSTTSGNYLGTIMSYVLNKEEKKCFLEIVQNMQRESIKKLINAVKGI